MELLRKAIDAISTCCLNCREDETGIQTENTPLLSERNGLQITNSIPSYNQIDYQNSVDEQKDEQSALNRIVQETNSNIIDVAALDTHHVLEQSEYNDRIKMYNQRIAQQWNSIQMTENSYNGLLRDVPNPDLMLSVNPQIDDVLKAKEFIKESAQVINEMKIDNHEDLVVPFQVT